MNRTSRNQEVCNFRKHITTILCVVIPVIIYFVPALLCYLAVTGSTSYLKAISFICVPLIYTTSFPIVAGVISRPFLDGIISGKFPRNSGHRTYSKRRKYGVCWATLCYCRPVYFLVLHTPFLKKITFRLFGYTADLNFTLCPDSWIRDLSLLEFKKNVYISNRAVIGTSICHMGNTVSVDKIRIGENSIVGRMAMIAHGTDIGNDSDIGPETRIGVKVKIGENVSIGPMCTVNHYAIIGDNASVGARSYIGAGVRIAENVTIPPGSVIPDRTVWRNVTDMGKFISSTYVFDQDEIVNTDYMKNTRADFSWIL